MLQAHGHLAPDERLLRDGESCFWGVPLKVGDLSAFRER